MAKRLQFRGGTTLQNDEFIGADREITVDTSTWSLRLHDGTTAGGHTIGSGIPADGTIGQILAMASNTPGDVEWIDIPTDLDGGTY